MKIGKTFDVIVKVIMLWQLVNLKLTYWLYGKKGIKMYTVYDSKGVPYINVNDEMEADYIAYCIGGYYESNGRTVYV